MTRNRIFLIIGLLGLCLASVILFQLYWLNNAIQVKERQFEQNINIVMNRVIDKLQTKQAMFFIKGSTVCYGNDFDSLFNLNCAKQICNHGGIFKDESQISNNEPSNNLKIKLSFNTSQKYRNLYKYRENNANTDCYSGDKVMIFNQNGFDTNTYIDSEANTKVIKLLKVIDKLIGEYTSKNRLPDRVLNRQITDTILKAELLNKGVVIPYEFAIVNDQNRVIDHIQSVGFTPDMVNTHFKVNLFPDEITNTESKYLILFFPTKSSFILKSIRLVLLSSLLLTLVIIGTFAFTIRLVLFQKKVSEIKTDFINNMTHEFKTPLATISLAIDSITNPKVIGEKEQILNFARIIKSENNRMNSHVEHVLQMALLDKNEFQFHREEINIHDLIINAVDKIKLQIIDREGIVNLKLNATASVIQGDSKYLLNAFINLIDNANKYSKERPDILIETSNNSNKIVVKVSDKGIGLTKDQLLKVFEKFYRAATGNVHNVKGFGLGLSFTKAVILAHNGTIHAESEPGKGSTFEIVLPVILNNQS